MAKLAPSVKTRTRLFEWELSEKFLSKENFSSCRNHRLMAIFFVAWTNRHQAMVPT
jgi:hypothetical protein